MSHTPVSQPTIGNFTRSNHLAQLSPQTSTTPIPFGLWTTITTAKILYTSSTQMQELTGMTTPIIKELPLPLSAMNNRAQIGTMTEYASGPQGSSGEKTTQAPTLHEQEHSYPRNAGSSTTSIQTLNLHDQSLLLPFLLLLTHLAFSHSLSQKQVPVPRYNNSVSEEAPDRTHAHRPLQRLFRPYPKPTPHPHPYLRLRLRNPYYAIKSTFDTSTNPMLCRLHKPTFRHHYNKLRRCITSSNIPRWTPHKSCKLWPPSPRILPHSHQQC